MADKEIKKSGAEKRAEKRAGKFPAKISEGRQNVIVIGGGIAGLSTAVSLEKQGLIPIIIEKSSSIGGNAASWDRLFPKGRKADSLIEELKERSKGIKKLYGETIIGVEKQAGGTFTVKLESGISVSGQAVAIATGFSLFEARRKEEYGYGIYENVITSKDLEEKFSKGEVLTADGKTIKKIGFVHCVGSRDEKIGRRACSKVCCVTAVKQACEVKELYPEADVYCFYIDLRMYGRYFEDLYYDAQTKSGVRFVRGRLCEASETDNKQVRIRVEDTLLSQTMNMNLDMLVLMVGFEANNDSRQIAEMFGVHVGKDGFFSAEDDMLAPNESKTAGVFLCGTCKGAKDIPETVADANSAAMAINNYLRN